jgi:16S rRNA (cytosine1402-N4)-methyltransferase
VSSGDGAPHIPVLCRETIEVLAPERGGVFVDCTTGAGGHALALLAGLPAEARLICIDQDERAREVAATTGLLADSRVTMVQANFADLGGVLADLGLDAIDGLLADLGVSSMQLDEAGRGFSFQRDEPLRMVMDQQAETDAQHWLASVETSELAQVLRAYGDERRARRVAAAIKSAEVLETTGQLAEAICRGLGEWPRPGRKHPATRSFMAIRIAVNRELDVLDELLDQLPAVMAAGGIAALISFHSIEHRRVRRWVRTESVDDYGPRHMARRTPLRAARFDNLTRKGLAPTAGEQETNPRSRSAQLRAVRRRPADGPS